MITLPFDWRQVDASDDPEMEVLAHGPMTGYGYAPTVIVRRLPHLEGGPEAGMSAMLEGGMREDPTHRIIDVGETVLAGYPAAVAVFTYCIEQKSLKQILYFATPDELPSGYVLALIAATPDFGPMAGVFADIVASFQPEGF